MIASTSSLPMKTVIVNLVCFKIGWTALVLSAAAGMPAYGTAIAAVVIAFHLWQTNNVRAEVLLLTCAGLTGVVIESALVRTHFTHYEVGILVPGFAPYWIVVMWVLFATTLNTGLRWLRTIRRSWIIAALMGAIGGPLAFLAGEALGAVTFVDPMRSLLVIGISWANFLPLLVILGIVLEGKFEGLDAPEPA